MHQNKYIPVAEPNLSGNEKKYLDECIKTGWISSKGKFINEFETGFAKYIGTKYALSSSNGTTALHLAFAGLGLTKGDEVIVPDFTFIASANAITYTGAKPIFADVEMTTWNIDPLEVEKKISKRTKVILVVHIYGHPAQMEKIIKIANKYKLFIVEDSAESLGSEINLNGWKRLGSIGKVGTFSFFGNKTITTGEGGMVVTNSKELYEKMKIFRDHGQDPKKRYFYNVVGFNYRLTNLQAAIGLAQLEKINGFVQKKKAIGKEYNKLLKNIPGITLPPSQSWGRSSYWMYSILVDKPYSLTRDDLIEILAKESIESRPFFYPIHNLPIYKEEGSFNNSTYLHKHGLSLPSSVNLSSKDIKRIASILNSYDK